MTRVALLGATGSIGTQALDVIAANAGLELVAATSGSTPIDGLAPLTQVGGDPTSLLERAQPDVVLNATLGFAGLPATMWALEHGVTLALANKESLVAAGSLALAAQERGGGRILPVDSEHSALFQCLEGRRADQIDTLVLTVSGGLYWFDRYPVRFGHLESAAVFPLGNEYHLPHHLFPMVPHYNLRKLHDLLLHTQEYRQEAIVVEQPSVHAPRQCIDEQAGAVAIDDIRVEVFFDGIRRLLPFEVHALAVARPAHRARRVAGERAADLVDA